MGQLCGLGRGCISCEKPSMSKSTWDWCATRVMSPRMALRLKRLAVLVKTDTMVKGGQIKVLKAFSDQSIDLYNDGRAIQLTYIKNGTHGDADQMKRLAALSVCAGFDFIKFPSTHIEAFVKEQSGYRTTLNQFPSGTVMISVNPPLDNPNEFSYPESLQHESKKPALIRSLSDSTPLSKHFKIGDFKESSTSYLRIDSTLVECLDMVKDSFKQGIDVLKAYTTKSTNMEMNSEWTQEQLDRFQMGQAVVIQNEEQTIESTTKLTKLLMSTCTPALRLQRRGLSLSIREDGICNQQSKLRGGKYCGWYVFYTHRFSMYIELYATDLSQTDCGCYVGEIKINNILVDKGICKQCSANEVKTSVGKLCNEEKKCSSPQNDEFCLFHPRYLSPTSNEELIRTLQVLYCYDKLRRKQRTSIFPEKTTESKITTEALYSTVSSYSTNTVNKLTTGTHVYTTQDTSTATVGSTVSLEIEPFVQLDMQGRVLVYNPIANKSFTVCGNHWYGDDANVLCKQLDKNSNGIASQLPKHPAYATVDLKFQCTGDEMSIYDCNSTIVGLGCNVSTVAAVTCCPGDGSSKCTDNTQPISNTMPSTELNIGVVIGIVLGVLLIVCVMIVIVVFIRRGIGPKKKNEQQSRDSSNNDYTGIQDIAMPIANEHRPPYPGLEMETRDDQYHDISDVNNDSNKNISDPSKYVKPNNKNKNVGDQRSHNDSAIPDPSNETVIISNSHSTVNNYVVLDPNETGFNRSEGPEKMNGSYELAQPIHHIDHSKDSKWKRKTSNDVYAHSEEGVYDSSNGNRHKESESNIYSLAIDNVYDSSNHTRKNGEAEDNYDHFSGKKTDDDYDISQI
ncbi:unnamed protein product [Mytilus edulis]|uniref:SRCR domain-containing protein n=1 Tax=Mytilus edulis TaxID=6550 RepID=A0A8S3R592_MYTED|nr:unnamed protein product [Mytilus edulis]